MTFVYPFIQILTFNLSVFCELSSLLTLTGTLKAISSLSVHKSLKEGARAGNRDSNKCLQGRWGRRRAEALSGKKGEARVGWSHWQTGWRWMGDSPVTWAYK